MAGNNPHSPRQKMINLLYLVFIGMLALNVSNEVLDGFELVEESLLRTVKASSVRNELVFGELETYHTTNPEKTKKWYDLAAVVKTRSDSLFNYAENLKLRIVRKADGKDGDPQHLKRPDDLNAAYEVMFEAGKNDATKLKKTIDSYRGFVTSEQMISDPIKKRIIESNLSTEPSRKAKENRQTWEESMFFQMPVAAAITLLTKIQNDVRYAEGEVLSTLLNNIDLGDFRVNQIKAYVIPESQVVMKGGTYTANIVLSAEDSTQRPQIMVNGRTLDENLRGLYRSGAGAPGVYPVKGSASLKRSDGSILSIPFESKYFVTEPSATVAPVLMNVLYAGIPNEIRIAVPGVASQNIDARISNGNLTRKGELWVVTPSLGSDAIVSVTAKMSDNSVVKLPETRFRVRALPAPKAFLDAGGQKFYTGKLSKSVLGGINELKAAIDDGILDIPFNVVRFQVAATDNLGNTSRESSEGAQFTQRQKDLIRRTERGKLIVITGITVKGPDGVTQNIQGVDITVN